MSAQNSYTRASLTHLELISRSKYLTLTADYFTSFLRLEKRQKLLFFCGDRALKTISQHTDAALRGKYKQPAKLFI